MNTRTRLIIVLGVLALCFLPIQSVVGQEAGLRLIIATFDECMRPTEYVQDWGVFEEKARAEANCVTLSPPDTGQAMKITYNVLRPGSYCGFWLKWEVPAFNPTQWDHLSFRIRSGAVGAARKVKVELKIKEANWGWKIYYVENITTNWQTISIPLDDFTNPPWGRAGWTKPDEFVITFENAQVTKQTGTIYIDDIAFTSGKPSPTGTFTWNPLEPVTGESVTFNASSSSALDGWIVKYEWDWNSDGTFDYSTSNSVTHHLFTSPGTHQVTLRITNDKGGMGEATKTITVRDKSGSRLVIATFDGCTKLTDYVHDWGVFEENATAKASCITLSPPDTGQGMKITYKVLHLRSYCGFWLQWRVSGFNLQSWDHLSFRIRSDAAGATERLKVELKIKESNWGWKTYYVENITTDWQTILIPLDAFTNLPWGRVSGMRYDEFVITFEKAQVTRWRGTIYIDDIAFTSENPSSTGAFNLYTEGH